MLINLTSKMTNFLKDTNYHNTHKEIENLNNHMSAKCKLITTNLPVLITLGADSFTDIIYEYYTKSFRKQKERTFQLIFVGRIPPITK